MLVTPTRLQTAPGTLNGPTAQPSPVAAALRRMVADANFPRHPHYQEHCAYIEDARMARTRTARRAKRSYPSPRRGPKLAR